MIIDTERTRQHLRDFAFRDLFVEELGWNRPGNPRPSPVSLAGMPLTQRYLAELGGVMAIEITSEDGIPDAKTRRAIHREIAQQHHENLVIFTDAGRTQSLWRWEKREDGKSYPREHLYVAGQSGDLFMSKISAMFVGLADLDEHGRMGVVDASARLRRAGCGARYPKVLRGVQA